MMDGVKIRLQTLHDGIIQVALIGDTHCGSIGFDKALFTKSVELIKDQQMYWLFMGDIVDAISVTDKRFDWNTLDPDLPTIKDQYAYMLNELHPIRERCLGVLTGNHDEKIRNKSVTGYDYTMMFCRDLNVTYLGYASFITLNMSHGQDRWSQTIFAWHGDGKGRKMGGKVNRITDIAGYVEADIYAMGHTHQLNVHQRSRLYHLTTGRHNKPVKRTQTFLHTGGFLQGYTLQSGYVEKQMLSPARLGFVNLKLRVHDHAVGVELIGE